MPGGRCETCEGNGQLRIEMHFLPDVWVECDTCRGQRYNPETLAVTLPRPVDRRRAGHDLRRGAAGCSSNIPKIRRILQTLCDVGLDYLTLGQPAPTLSGGEAQRVKLAAELSRPDTGRTLYLLDEPTTGLHFDDLAKLLDVLNRLVDLGNTVVVIEHNLDVIKTADWVIDMGPEAGERGRLRRGRGTPGTDRRATPQRRPRGARRGQSRPLPLAHRRGPRPRAGGRAAPAARDLRSAARAGEPRDGDLDITEVGREAKMPWEVDGRRWHTQDRVGRNGEPCRWDGRILAARRRPHPGTRASSARPTGTRAASSRSPARRRVDGWFFHAITGETWLLKMKFRTAKGTFRREQLVSQLDLKPLNEMPDLPLYGNEPRVRCKNLARPVAGSRTARALAGRDRQARVLGVPRKGGAGLSEFRRAGGGPVR